MKDYKVLALTILAVLGLIVSVTSMADDAFEKPVPQSTVDLCVSEIADHADYNGAARVRHEIKTKERRTIGHILKIDTRVYNEKKGQVIREYATRCVVGNGEKPVKFEMKEIVAGL